MMSRALARAVGAILVVYRAIVPVKIVHGEHYEGLRGRGVPILFALWHGRMLFPIQNHRKQGIVTMASQSKDGEVIARWLTSNGYVVVRGSTTRGGGQALREMVRHVRSGRHAALTVDGPKGPARVVQPGVVQLARLTEAWVLPITSASARPRFLKSWDRYLLPSPFAKCVVLYGEPFPIDVNLSDSVALSKIGDALDAATREADEMCGLES
jgi:lysophospholipid acyltransferase (LPLAT)-like uncharacterized protein